MNPFRVLGAAVSAVFDEIAPLDTPPDMPVEPVLTGDELVGVRQLLEERFPTQFLHHK